METGKERAAKANATAEQQILAATRTWLEKAVIGLNLCPFAKAVHIKGQIRYALSTAKSPQELVDDLVRELQILQEADPAKVDTTLLIHPYVLCDFLDFNDFLSVADLTVKELGLEGVIQLASFHPDYQFADASPDDIENHTNRAPFPILHLLREESIARAVDAFPAPEKIYERNMETLRRLGHEGWNALGIPEPLPKSDRKIK